MLSGWTLPRAELLALDQDVVTLQLSRAVRGELLQCEALAAPGASFRARFRVLGPASGMNVTRRAHRLGYPARPFTYRCVLEEPQAAMAHLRVLLEPLAPLRSSPRVPRRVRVLSPALPDYAAVASDLSLTGIGLRCRAPLEVGLRLPLCLDTEVGKCDLEAEIRWCRAVEAEFAAGARFQEVAREALHLLEKLTEPAELVPCSANERLVVR